MSRRITYGFYGSGTLPLTVKLTKKRRTLASQGFRFRYNRRDQAVMKRVRYLRIQPWWFRLHRTDHILLILSKQDGSKICQFLSFRVHVEPTYSVADQDPGSGAFWLWIRDGKKSGSRMTMPDHISEGLSNIFWIKNTLKLWCGSGIFSTQDSGIKSATLLTVVFKHNKYSL